MKTVKSTFFLLAALLCAACSSDEPLTPTSVETPETIEVSLRMSGDVVTTSEGPIVKATIDKKRIYGINVYYAEADGRENYQHYAYGLFDNVDDMTISLISKYTYKFECTIVEDDYDALYHTYNSDYNVMYAEPFKRPYSSRDSEYTPLLNKFIVSTTSSMYLNQIKSGTSYVKHPGEDYATIITQPALDRLYGELSGYVPQAGGTATIPMKRTAFGAKFVIAPPSDGKLTVRTDFFSASVSAGEETKTVASLYTFFYVNECYNYEGEYEEVQSLELTWERSNGATQQFKQSITVKRNVMTTFNISVEGSTGDASIGFTEDTPPAAGDPVNITFDGGSQGDNNVDPEE